MSTKIEYSKYIIVWIMILLIIKYIFNNELSIIDIILVSTFFTIILAIFEYTISMK